MADDEVSTKAPESDAKEPSMVSSEDTSAQTGASMGVTIPTASKPCALLISSYRTIV